MAFYVMKCPIPPDTPGLTEYESAEPVNLGDAPSCPVCGKTLGNLAWLPPYRVRLEVWGRTFGDIVWEGYDFLVSQRFVGLYRQAGMKGLEGFHTAEVVKVRYHKAFSAPVPEYYVVSPVRSRAEIDIAGSGCDYEKPPTCPECREGYLVKRARRIRIKEGTWSGEDVFVARGLGGPLMATGRFKAFCEEHHLLGATFIDAEEYRFDFHPNEKKS